MLFKIRANNDVFKDNPELLSISQFSELTDRQMKYVILAFDYKSPFRKLEWSKRKEQAALAAGYKLEKDGKRLDRNGRAIVSGANKAVEIARKYYNTISKDEDYETLLGLSKLITDIKELNAAPNKSLQELEKAVKFSKELPALMKAKKELEDILEMREDEVTDIGAEQSQEESQPVMSMSILAQLNEEEATE